MQMTCNDVDLVVFWAARSDLCFRYPKILIMASIWRYQNKSQTLNLQVLNPKEQ